MSLPCHTRTFHDGLTWLSQSHTITKTHYFKILGGLLMTMLVQCMSGMIPILSIIIGPIISAAMWAGLLLFVHMLFQSKNPDIQVLFTCFNENRGRWLHLILIQFFPWAFTIVFLILPIGIFLFMFGNFGSIEHQLEQFAQNPTITSPIAILTGISLLIYVLVALLVVTPAMLYALPLSFFEKLSAQDALRLSFHASWKNMYALTGYSLVLFGMSLFGILFFFIGIFFVFPWIITSYMKSYYEIFSIPNINT
ncbi:MAG: hypothetical protein KDD46_04960 [Bdellovibrionales bacterium]|nr:hypothetical protein [Bdellovibrionales bacterium]